LKSLPGKKSVVKQGSLSVAVLGATGYAGVELLRILIRHPRVKLTAVTSQQYASKRASDVYPSLAGRCDLILEELRVDKVASRSELAFAALPHETSMDVVAGLLERK
jgi:N-acetyl-gamma-glutamyl-phosphate reductase